MLGAYFFQIWVLNMCLRADVNMTHISYIKECHILYIKEDHSQGLRLCFIKERKWPTQTGISHTRGT